MAGKMEATLSGKHSDPLRHHALDAIATKAMSDDVLTLAERLGVVLERVIQQRDIAENKIAEHDYYCDLTCHERAGCDGYRKSGRMCPDCPKYWKINE